LNGEGYINGFQFHLEYDTAGMVVSDVQAVWPVISQWENFAFNETINGSTASLHIAAYPWDTDGTDSLALAVDDNPYLVMITWEITSPDEPFQKEVQFAWTDCADNSLAVLDWDGSRFDTPDYLAVSNKVHGATNQEITGLSPRYGGVSDACLSGGSGGAPPQRQIDFHGGLLVYDTLCCDVTGDVRPPYDGNTDLSDVLWYVQFLFLGDFPPPCVASLNVNGDPACNADLADIVYLVNYLFLGGPPPADCRRRCDYWE
jgi:hypothetical protein